MTTSYRRAAVEELRAQKKLDREREMAERMKKNEEEAKAHDANMLRIAEKEKRILQQSSDDVAAPSAPVRKKAPAKKKASKKRAGGKRKKAGRKA